MDIIGERLYDVLCPDGTSFPIVTCISRPVPQPTGEWDCDIYIVRNGHPQPFKIFGGDSLEALELSMTFLSRMVELLRSDYGDRLKQRGIADEEEQTE